MNDYISKIDTSSVQQMGDGSLAVKAVTDAGLNAFMNGVSMATSNKVTDPYSQSDWVFDCVNITIDSCSFVPLMLSSNNDKIIESGPLVDLLFGGDDDDSWQTKIEEMVGYLQLFRGFYLVFDEMIGNRPTNWIVCSEMNLKPKIIGGVLRHWTLFDDFGKEQIIFDDQVYKSIRFTPNKLAPYKSISPLKPGELMISTARQAEQLNEAALRNGGKVGNVVEVPGSMTPEDKLYLRNQFDNYHGSAKNAGRTAVLSGGAKISAVAQTMVELDMLNLRRFDASGICALFGVPPELLGLNSEAQYAHGPAQQRFVTNTCIPLLNVIAQALTYGIAARMNNVSSRHNSIKAVDAYSGKFKVKQLASYRSACQKAARRKEKTFCWFAVEEHPTIQEMLKETAEKVLTFTKSGVALNQLVRAYDLPFEEMPWGDEAWADGIKTSYSKLMKDEESDEPLPKLPEGDDGGNDKHIQNTIPTEQKAKDDRYWKAYARILEKLEKRYIGKIRGYFSGQQIRIIKQLKAALAAVDYNPENKNKDLADNVIMRISFDLTSENNKLRVINRVEYINAAEVGAGQVANEIAADDAKDLIDTAMKRTEIVDSLKLSSSNLVSINTVTKNLVTRTLTEGINSGESLEELTQRIQKALGSNRARAARIARTQVSGAISSGRQATMKQSGVKYKRWITSKDDAVRPEHAAANNQVVKVDGYFSVGGEQLMHPGDPAGSAKNIINCRCVSIAHFKE